MIVEHIKKSTIEKLLTLTRRHIFSDLLFNILICEMLFNFASAALSMHCQGFFGALSRHYWGIIGELFRYYLGII